MKENHYGQFTEEELIMRDKLALSRTLLANERTVLAYTRTALTFVVAGLTFLQVFPSLIYTIIAIIFLVFGIILFIITPIRYRQIRSGIADQCAPHCGGSGDASSREAGSEDAKACTGDAGQ